jgi:hypothetical protein
MIGVLGERLVFANLGAPLVEWVEYYSEGRGN